MNKIEFLSAFAHYKDMNTPLKDLIRVTPSHQKALAHLGITTVRDLLHHFPIRYKSFADYKAIADLTEGEEVTIQGRVIKAKAEKTWKKKMKLAETIVSDGSGSLRIVWFHQPYMANILSGGALHTFSGKVTRDKKGLLMTNPRYETISHFSKEKDIVVEKGDHLTPYYPETKGISSRWMTFAIQKIFHAIQKGAVHIEDTLPEDIRKRYHLPDMTSALSAIHAPKKHTHVETARKRFAFEEIFYIQLIRQQERIARKAHPSFVIQNPEKTLAPFLSLLSFSLTRAQKKAIDALFSSEISLAFRRTCRL